MELDRAIELYLSVHQGMISTKTMRIYMQSLGVLKDYLGDRDAESISIDDLRAYRTALFDRNERYTSNTSRPREKGGLSVWTIHGHIRVARQFFRWLSDEGKIGMNPAARLELPSLGDEPPKGISESDLRKMFECASASARDFAILMFLADTGCRIGGAAGLELSDLDFEKRRAIVREKGRNARAKVRAVFFKQTTADALNVWLTERSQLPKSRATNRVFVGRKGALTADGIYEIVVRIGERAGVTGRFNPHSFRHGFARALLERGLDLGRVSKMLGHSDTRVTAKFYGVFSETELAEAHEKFSWVE